jgi:hypothetical protein
MYLCISIIYAHCNAHLNLDIKSIDQVWMDLDCWRNVHVDVQFSLEEREIVCQSESGCGWLCVLHFYKTTIACLESSKSLHSKPSQHDHLLFRLLFLSLTLHSLSLTLTCNTQHTHAQLLCFNIPIVPKYLCIIHLHHYALHYCIFVACKSVSACIIIQFTRK